jgi:hypothetical protein
LIVAGGIQCWTANQRLASHEQFLVPVDERKPPWSDDCAGWMRTYGSRLLMKLDARDHAQLIIIAYETGLISAQPPTT